MGSQRTLFLAVLVGGFSALAVLAGCDGSSECSPDGEPVSHAADIVADETWSSGIHQVPATIHISNGARLTIDACSTVQLAPASSLIVDKTASGIDVNGTAAGPVLFTRQQQSGAWDSLQVTAPATARLSYTTIEGGGGSKGHDSSTLFAGASLVARGDAKTTPVVLTLDHTAVRDSAGLGLFLQSARVADTSQQLVVTGSGWYPVYGGIAAAASLPTGTYTGNAIDQILLQTVNVAVYADNGPLTADATLRDRGVPYRVGIVPSSIVVGSGLAADPSALLTIEGGVKLLFTPQGSAGMSQLRVNGINDGGDGKPQGALAVLGTPVTPVTFNSAAQTPAAGDWQGLYFSNFVDLRTIVSGAQILNAGGWSGAVGVCESAPGSGQGSANCAVVIMVYSAPGAFLQGSSITNSGGCGVYRGWKNSVVEFEGTNQFSHVPGCIQTNIPNHLNACSPNPCRTAL